MKKKLIINGMSCSHCENNVKMALTEEIKGIKVLHVSSEKNYALVDMDESVDEKELKDLIEDLGYELKEIQ